MLMSIIIIIEINNTDIEEYLPILIFITFHSRKLLMLFIDARIENAVKNKQK